MKLSAEITMYPFHEEYRPKIKAFIDELASRCAVRRETFPTCTVLTGEYDEVMELLAVMMKWSHETLGKAVFVVKFLPGYEAL
ncbi:MAG: hypothetical protein CMK32_16225 [Porticoccaceae bacterium]|nr:hypothetical protein [Porticoccaceae bacterium]